MKYQHLVYGFIFFSSLSAANSAHSQSKKSLDSIAYGSSSIVVSDRVTTHLIFKNDINYVDIGSAAFAVDKLKNIVKIKCTELEKWNTADRSNITVLTTDGYYYSIWVSYKENPSVKTYIYAPEDSFKLNSFDLLNNDNCKSILSKTSNFNKEHYNHKMKYEVNGIFYQNDQIVIRLKIENESNINFSTDSIRFILTTRKKYNPINSLRTKEPIQYNEKSARFVCNNTKDIPGKSSHTYLFGFSRFIPTDAELLEIKISENKSGGRRGIIILKIKDFLLKY